MIIDPTAGFQATERSPLKNELVGAANPSPNVTVSPPAYTPSPSYQAVSHPQFAPQPPQPTSQPAFSRFIKAFGMALLVLFLWCLFLDTVDVISVRYGGPKRKRMDIVPASWHSSPPATTSCLLPAPPGDAGRVLPIQYPPLIRAGANFGS